MSSSPEAHAVLADAISDQLDGRISREVIEGVVAQVVENAKEEMAGPASRVDPAVAGLVLSGLAYAAAYLYDWTYLTGFGLSITPPRLPIERIVAIAVGLGAWFLSYMYAEAWIWSAFFRTPIVGKHLSPFLPAILIQIWVTASYPTVAGGIGLLLLVPTIGFIIWRNSGRRAARRQARREQKLRAQVDAILSKGSEKEEEDASTTGAPYLHRFQVRHIGNFEREYALVLVFLLQIAWAGYAVAVRSTVFQVRASDDAVVLRNYGSEALLAHISDNNEIVGWSIEPTADSRFVRRDLGQLTPLHVEAATAERESGRDDGR